MGLLYQVRYQLGTIFKYDPTTHLTDFILLYTSENQIDGESFLALTESDVKEMVKPIGVVKKIMKLQREVYSTWCALGCTDVLHTMCS